MKLEIMSTFGFDTVRKHDTNTNDLYWRMQLKNKQREHRSRFRNTTNVWAELGVTE